LTRVINIFLTILLICIIVPSSAAQVELDQGVSITTQKMPLKDVLWRLGEQSDIPIVFKDSDISDKLVTIEIKDEPIWKVLNEIFYQTPNYYRLIDGQIYIFSDGDQNQILNGYVEDATTGERLIGASIFNIPSIAGTTTNNFGFFSLERKSRDSLAKVTYIGYQAAYIDLSVISAKAMIIKLVPDNNLPEIVISGKETDESSLSLPSDQNLLNVFPLDQQTSVGGEADIIRMINQLPGTTTGTDGIGGLHVRGGNADQNLVMLDGVPIYNPYHSLGLFSIFDENTMSTVSYLKGGFPARFGGRISSVLDVRLKDGNFKKFKAVAGVGLLNSKLLLEGPIIRDKLSFMVSGRATHISPILQRADVKEQLLQTDQGSLSYGYQDFVGKITYSPSSSDRFYLSYYSGRDRFDKSIENDSTDIFSSAAISSSQNLDWGNQLGVLRWNHQYSSNLFSHLTMTYSRFTFDSSDARSATYYTDDTFTEIETVSIDSEYLSDIEKRTARLVYEYIPSNNHYISTGFLYALHNYKPGIAVTEDIIETPINTVRLTSSEINFFVEDEWKISRTLRANIGLFTSIFSIDQQRYNSLEPRLSLRWKASPKWIFGTSASRVSQNLHVLSRTGSGFPTDLWVPSTSKVKPQSALVFDLDAEHKITKKLTATGSIYYKDMSNIISYTEDIEFGSSSDLINSENWEENVTVGTGRARGAELQLQYRSKKWSGTASYHLAQSDRQFELINRGRRYPFRYEHRKKLLLAWSYNLSSKWHVNSTWSYNTGTFSNVPLNKWQYIRQDGNFDFFYYELGDKNSFKLPDYHRLDLSATYDNPTSWGALKVNFGVYNVYNRKNIFYISSQYSPTTDDISYKGISIIPILPYLSLQATIQ